MYYGSGGEFAGPRSEPAAVVGLGGPSGFEPRLFSGPLPRVTQWGRQGIEPTARHLELYAFDHRATGGPPTARGQLPIART